jgi:gas vesicle protein
MGNHGQERSYCGNVVGGFLGGLLMGSLVGVVTMLLLARQATKETRARVRQEGLELPRQVADTVEGAMVQARDQARRLTADVHKQAQELQRRGREFIDWHRERSTAAVEAGETAEHTIPTAGGD